MMQDTIRILAIDPGSNIGISIYTVTVPELVIVHIETHFLDLSYYEVKDSGTQKMRNKLRALESNLITLLNYCNPHILAIEDTFVNVRFPKSAIILAQYIATIELTSLRLNPFICIYKFAPKLVKSGVGAGGNADKDVMLCNIKTIPEITQFVNPDRLSEHEIDSLAIGYLTVTNLRSAPGALLTL